MKVLVTGSAGHLGEALMRTLSEQGTEAIGIDILDTPFTTRRGSITDRAFVQDCMQGVTTVLHTATLHKPHVATHSLQQFIDTNITGTLNLLEEAVAAGVEQFIYTSTTSVFGDALVPPAGAPATWITEDVVPAPKNIYGTSKAAAEDLCQLFYRNQGLACMVLRTSRFFPEDDDDPTKRDAYEGDNLKANEYLYRRVAIEDAVSAHLLAAEKAKAIGFGRYIISATTPFAPEHLQELRDNAPAVVQQLVPEYLAVYESRGWKMLPEFDRVYVNQKARVELGWEPRYDFRYLVQRLQEGESVQSPMARLIGIKGYHAGPWGNGLYPITQ